MNSQELPQNSNDHINRYNTVHFPLSMIIKQKAWKKKSNKKEQIKNKKKTKSEKL